MKVGYNVVVFEFKFNILIGEVYRFMNESYVMVGVYGVVMIYLLFFWFGFIFI